MQGTALRPPGRDDRRLQTGRGKRRNTHPDFPYADVVPDPGGAQPADPADLPRRDRAARAGGAVREQIDPGHPVRAHGVPHPQRPADHPQEGEPFPGRATLHLEDRPGRWPVRADRRRRQQAGDPVDQVVDAHPGDRGPEVHRMHPPPHPQRRHRPVLHESGEHLVVVVREAQQVHVGANLRVPGADPVDAAHRDDRGTDPRRDLVQQPVEARSGTVHLVHEDQRRDAQPVQGAGDHPGLCLHALDGRDDQDSAVKNRQCPLHLGDEIRVPGRVDQIDRTVVNAERDDRGLDGDPASPFQLQGVGLRAAVVHAADLVDDPGGVQKPLGEAGLTGVDVRQDAEIENTQA